MFWWLGVLIVVVMAGVLQAMSGQLSGEFEQFAWMTAPTVKFARLVLMGIATILGMGAICYQQRRNLSDRLTSAEVKAPSSYVTNILSAPLSLLSTLISQQRHLLSKGIFAALLVAVLVASALIALLAQYHAHLRSLPQPIRVQAMVTIEGLSDSLYDPKLGRGYRQVAILTEIVPLDQHYQQQRYNQNSLGKNKAKSNGLGDVNNPWSNDNGGATESASTTSILSADAPTPKATSSHTDSTLKVLLTAYPTTSKAPDDFKLLNSLAPNQQLRMTLALAPIDDKEGSDQAEATGFNSVRWLRSRHIDASARVLALDYQHGEIKAHREGRKFGRESREETGLSPLDSGVGKLAVSNALQRLRWDLRQHFMRGWKQQTKPQQQARAVTLSLLTGDRALIDRDTKNTYQLAGISHLLAISGSHVLFLAIILAGLVVALVNQVGPRLYIWLPRWQLRWIVMVMTAFMYAAFTGFDVPAARTAWMLVAIGLVRVSLLPISSLKVLMVLAILMAWYDPFVLWQAGYWLSFIAVALLLIYELVWRANSNSDLTLNPKVGADSQQLGLNTSSSGRYHDNPSWLLRGMQVFKAQSWQLIKLQLWLFIALLPVTLLLFGKVSLWGLIINLFAIGLYGLVIVPLNLLSGLCYLIAPALADQIWSLTVGIVAITHALIENIVEWPLLGSQNDAWLYTPVNLGTLIIISLVFLPWLLAKGVLSRWSALPPATLLALTITTGNHDSSDNASTVYLLPTSETYLSAVLLKNDSQQAHWLILADYRTPKQAAFVTLNAQRLSETLQQQLGMLGVDSLQGIIVQTPDPILALAANKSAINDSITDISTSQASSLSASAILLSAQLPTGQLWQAGIKQNNKTQNDGGRVSSSVPCKAGQNWHSKDSSLAITAMTGWPDVNSQSVGGCVIAIQSAQPITVYKFSAANPIAPEWLATTLVGDDNNINSIKAQANSKVTHQHTLIIDAASHRHLWPLWQMMCVNESSKHSGTSTGLAPNLSPRFLSSQSTVFISHRNSQIDNDVQDLLQADYMLDNLGQRMKVTLMETSPQKNDKAR